MIGRSRWFALRVLSWLVLGTCWIGCAKPVPQTPVRVESPPAIGDVSNQVSAGTSVDSGAGASKDEPRLGDEEP